MSRGYHSNEEFMANSGLFTYMIFYDKRAFC